MRLYNNYILTVASLLLLTTVILATLGQTSLDVYYTIYVIEALIVTELYVYFNARARRGLRLVSAVLFSGFLVIVFMQIVRTLT